MECYPNGRNGVRARVCNEKGVKSYPTWEFRNRTYNEVLDLDRLARLTGFRAPPDGTGQ